MTDLQQIEAQVRRLLETETSGIRLSNLMFSPPHGLFCGVGANVEERRAISATPLYREVQERITMLMRQEAAAFSRIVEEVGTQLPGTGYRVKLEQIES